MGSAAAGPVSWAITQTFIRKKKRNHFLPRNTAKRLNTLDYFQQKEENKLASFEATLVGNYDPPTDSAVVQSVELLA